MKLITKIKLINRENNTATALQRKSQKYKHPTMITYMFTESFQIANQGNKANRRYTILHLQTTNYNPNLSVCTFDTLTGSHSSLHPKGKENVGH